MWTWSFTTFATWWHIGRADNWKRPWCWERLRAGGEGDNREWDVWMASPTQRTWMWANSGYGEGQGSLAYCSLQDCRESDTAEQLNNNIQIGAIVLSLELDWSYDLNLKVTGTPSDVWNCWAMSLKGSSLSSTPTFLPARAQLVTGSYHGPRRIGNEGTTREMYPMFQSQVMGQNSPAPQTCMRVK